MPDLSDPRNKGWTDARTADGKRERQAVFLRRIAEGEDPDAVRVDLGIGEHVFNGWRWRNPEDGFNSAYKMAKAGSARGDGEFPDFLNFRSKYFAYRNLRGDKDPNTGQLPFVRAVNSWYQVEGAKALEEHNRLIKVLPPGHIKTTLWAIEYSVYSIMKDRNMRILVIAKAHPEAKKIIGAVQERLECDWYHHIIEMMLAQGDNPIECPVCIYGKEVPFKPENRKMEANTSWGAEGFRVAGVTSGEKDLTMQAKGAGSQIQGIRADRIILDDVQDPQEGRKNPGASAELVSWFNEVILGRVTDLQQVVVLGNFFSPDDFVHKLLEEKEDIFGVINYPAILDENKRQILCPEFWTWDSLMAKKKEVGERAWWFTWMQEDQSFEDATFRREVLAAARDEGLALGRVPSGVTEVFIGVDPATSENGHCAMVCWGLNPMTKQRFLLEVFNKTGMRNSVNIANQIAYYCDVFQTARVHVIVEGNAQQKSVMYDPTFDRELRSRGVIIHPPYQTATGTGARAELLNFDITTIGALFDGGLVTLPYGGPTSERDRVDRYIDQLVQWRTDDSGHTIKHLKRDMVMATLFAESAAFEMSNRPKHRPLQGNRAPGWAKPWQRKKETPDRREVNWDGTPRFPAEVSP